MGLFTGIFWNFQTQHKKSSFPSSICSVNVAVTKEILYGKLHCLCCEKNICLEELWKIASLTCKLFIKALHITSFWGSSFDQSTIYYVMIQKFWERTIILKEIRHVYRKGGRGRSVPWFCDCPDKILIFREASMTPANIWNGELYNNS